MRLAPFGSYTGYLLKTYLRQVGAILTIFWLVALAIDISPQIGLLSAHAQDHPLRNILWFSALRTPWLIVPLIPFAVFLGVLATEHGHIRSGSRMLIWNSGRSPSQCLVPVLLLGFIFGSIDMVVDGWVGPETMAIQMRERLGRDGQRLDRSRASNFQWIALSNGLLRTKVVQVDGVVELRELSFFRFHGPERLVELLLAKNARQIAGSAEWRAHDGVFWGREEPARDNMTDILLGGSATTFSTHDLHLPANVLWLSVIGMEPQYVPFSILKRLADQTPQGYDSAVYRTREQVIIADVMLVLAMALTANVLATFFLPGSRLSVETAKILLAGYIAHSLERAFVLFGENGALPPVLAAWFIPVLLTNGVLVLLSLYARTSASDHNRSSEGRPYVVPRDVQPWR